MIQRSWLILPVFLMITGSAVKAFANPSDFFDPYLAPIGHNLPSGWTMRLPDKPLISNPSLLRDVRVIPLDSSPGIEVSLLSCDHPSPNCLVGSFSVESQTSATAQQALKEHQLAAPITLAKDIKGYLLEGNRQNPPSAFSSVMWEQDNLIYTIKFPFQERQNLLYMARNQKTHIRLSKHLLVFNLMT